MFAIQLRHFKQKAAKNPIFSRFKLAGFEPFQNYRWKLACKECGRELTHNAVGGTTSNLNDHIAAHQGVGRKGRRKESKDGAVETE